jgi:hypothetical protein
MVLEAFATREDIKQKKKIIIDNRRQGKVIANNIQETLEVIIICINDS